MNSYAETRLALDVGTNSIGWALYSLDDKGQPCALINVGVRIFPDGREPRTGDSLATQRRIPRGQRRRRDRFLRRQKSFMRQLIRIGLMPEEETARKLLQQLDPWRIRKTALDRQVPLHELGRAFFHLNQRRGFQSNRKAERKDGNSGKIKSAIENFEAEMEGRHRTVGEALFSRIEQGKSEGQKGTARARLRGKGVKASYDFYISRAMIVDEFDQLWAKQRGYYPDILTDGNYQALRDILTYQRPLKPPIIGKCSLEPDEERAPRAMPSSQLFRLYEEVNHLRLKALADRTIRALTREERDILTDYLSTRKEAKFRTLRQQILGRENRDTFVFTLEESGIRKKAIGNYTGSRMAHKKGFGHAWKSIPLEEQNTIIKMLLDMEDEQELREWLKNSYQLTDHKVDYLANVGLEEGYIRFSQKALGKILPPLMNDWDSEANQPLSYDKAVKAAGYSDHRAFQPGLYEELPYYGEILWRYTQDAPGATNADEIQYGRITNPTVHIGLNQIRKLTNAIIDRYGRPLQIHVELARELKANAKKKALMRTANRENQERNEKLNKRLVETFKETPNAENRLRLKLFDELTPLNRRCPYSGDVIRTSRLFTNDYQIDHILPFSKTLDDSYNNKLLVTRQANADKRDRDVHTFATLTPGYDWEDMMARVKDLPYHKRKRFEENALNDWLQSRGGFKYDGANFLQRQLTDTAYLSRVAKTYLESICPTVLSLPGHLTFLLRGKWGLNRILSSHNGKNRHDHRHHAVDAVIIGVIDRSLLQRISTLTGRHEVNGERLLENLDTAVPWPSFHADVSDQIKRMIVSHKPDHNPQARLHESTAYGIVSGPDERGAYLSRYTVELTALKSPKDLKLLENERLYTALSGALNELNGKAFNEALTRCIGKTIDGATIPAKVRIQRKISGITVPLRGTAISPRSDRRPAYPAKLYKGGSNYCYEIYIGEKNRWHGDLISTFVANQASYRAFMYDQNGWIRPEYRKMTFEGKPLIMRLIRNDTVAIEEKGQRRIMRVTVITEGKISLAEHQEANIDARNRDKNDPFSYIVKSPGALKNLKARRVFVDLLGYVKDPGVSRKEQ